MTLGLRCWRCRNLHYQPYAIGGTANHIHVLAGVPAKASASEAVQKLKANSSRDDANMANGRDGRKAMSLFRQFFEPRRRAPLHSKPGSTSSASDEQEFVSFWKDRVQRSTGTMCLIKCRPAGPFFATTPSRHVPRYELWRPWLWPVRSPRILWEPLTTGAPDNFSGYHSLMCHTSRAPPLPRKLWLSRRGIGVSCLYHTQAADSRRL